MGKVTLEIMKIKVKILSFFLLSILTSCTRNNYSGSKTASPSGKYYFITTVNRTDESKDDFADVILSLYSADGKLITQINTGAGDFNSWAIGWETKTDTIIMNSSDIGLYAWRLENNQLKKLEMTEALNRQAEKIKQDKYK